MLSNPVYCTKLTSASVSVPNPKEFDLAPLFALMQLIIQRQVQQSLHTSMHHKFTCGTLGTWLALTFGALNLLM